MVISNNIPALQAATNLGKTNTALSKSMNNLSIGVKIHSAKDDAAGLAITNKLKSQLSGLQIASQNSMDGISLVQTAEGALSEVTAMLQRMRELSVQAANDTNTPDDRMIIAIEYDNLRKEITEVAARTEFNKIKILSGELYKYQLGDENKWGVPEYVAKDMADNLGIIPVPPGDPGYAAYTAEVRNYLQGFTNELTMQVGPNKSMEFDFSIPKITASTLMLTPWPAVNYNGTGLMVEPYLDTLQTPPVMVEPDPSEFLWERAQRNLTEVDRAVDIVSGIRAHLGAAANRLEHTVASLDTTALNTDRARSRIEDTDMPYETTLYSSKNVIAQGAIAIIAQANQRPQSILQLL